MKLTFQIEYRTAWGEEIGVMLKGQENAPIMLGTLNGIQWTGSTEMEEAPAGVPLTYHYGVYRDGPWEKTQLPLHPERCMERPSERITPLQFCIQWR